MKLKRTLSSSCWSQNDDGTLSLIIGSKNNSDSESSDMPNSLEQDTMPQIVQDCNENVKNDVVLKSPQAPVQAVSAVKMPTIPTPVIENAPIKILQSNFSQNVGNYRQRQQLKRRDEMMAG